MNKKLPRVRMVMPRIKELNVGETIEFPIEWMDTVRSQTSKCNALLGGKRSTRLEVEDRKICVTRIQ